MQQKLERVSKAADKYADREAEVAAKAAPAPALQIRKVEQEGARRLRQTAAPTAEQTATFRLIAATVELARTEAAEAEAAACIRSVLPMIPY